MSQVPRIMLTTGNPCKVCSGGLYSVQKSPCPSCNGIGLEVEWLTVAELAETLASEARDRGIFFPHFPGAD